MKSYDVIWIGTRQAVPILTVQGKTVALGSISISSEPLTTK